MRLDLKIIFSNIKMDINKNIISSFVKIFFWDFSVDKKDKASVKNFFIRKEKNGVLIYVK